MTPQEANERYLDRVGINDPVKRAACLEAMAGYGENRWWEAENLSIIGYHQLWEKWLLVPGHIYRRGLEALLGRPFKTVELALSNRPNLCAEAREAWSKRQTDTGNDHSA